MNVGNELNDVTFPTFITFPTLNFLVIPEFSVSVRDRSYPDP